MSCIIPYSDKRKRKIRRRIYHASYPRSREALGWIRCSLWGVPTSNAQLKKNQNKRTKKMDRIKRTKKMDKIDKKENRINKHCHCFCWREIHPTVPKDSADCPGFLGQGYQIFPIPFEFSKFIEFLIILKLISKLKFAQC